MFRHFVWQSGEYCACGLIAARYWVQVITRTGIRRPSGKGGEKGECLFCPVFLLSIALSLSPSLAHHYSFSHSAVRSTKIVTALPQPSMAPSSATYIFIQFSMFLIFWLLCLCCMCVCVCLYRNSLSVASVRAIFGPIQPCGWVFLLLLASFQPLHTLVAADLMEAAHVRP